MDRNLSPSSASEWDSIPQTSDIPGEWGRLAMAQSFAAITRLQSVSPCHTDESEIEIILEFLGRAGPQVLVSFFQPPAPMSVQAVSTKFEQLATILWQRVHQKPTDRGKSCALICLGRTQLPAQSNPGMEVLLSLIGQLLQLNKIFDDEQGDGSRWKWLKDEEYRNYGQFVTSFTDVWGMLYRLLEEVPEFTLYIFLDSYFLNLDEPDVYDAIRGVLFLPQELKGKTCATVKVFAALPDGKEGILTGIERDKLRVWSDVDGLKDLPDEAFLARAHFL